MKKLRLMRLQRATPYGARLHYLSEFFPLFKLMPIIYRWYKKLAEVDPELPKDYAAAHLDQYCLAKPHRATGESNVGAPCHLPMSFII